MVRTWTASLLMLLAACSSARQDTSVVPDDEVVVLKEARFESVEGKEVRLSQGIYRVARAGDATLSVSGRAGKHALKAMPANVEGRIEGDRAILLTMPDEPPRLVWASKQGCLEAVPKSGAVRSRALLSQSIQLAPASLTVLDPNATSVWCANTQRAIRWRHSNTSSSYVMISLFRQVSGTLQWAATIASAAPNPLSTLTNSYTWAIQKTLTPGRYAIYVQTPDGRVKDFSDVFQIVGPAEFLGLGSLGGNRFYSHALAVSADGSTVVGVSDSGYGEEAFRWTRSSRTMENLGHLPGGASSSEAVAVSADGSTVVGWSSTRAGDRYRREAFRWSATTRTLEALGDLGGGYVAPPANDNSEVSSVANAVSDDGLVIVGLAANPEFKAEAFAKRGEAAMMGLGLGVATDVSQNGDVIAGTSFPYSDDLWLWSATASRTILGTGRAPAILSRDGTVVVASIDFAGTWQAGRCMVVPGSSPTGFVSLGSVAGGTCSSDAFGVSGSGADWKSYTIVGRYCPLASPALKGAFVWGVQSGMRDLASVIKQYGGSTAGWVLKEATGIAADGRTIVGYGTNPSGNTEAWMVTFPVPLNP